MPSLFFKKSGTWTEANSIFIKKSGVWIQQASVFLKKVNSWVQVFSGTKVPGTTTLPEIRDNFGGNVIDNDLYIANVGDTLVGYRGVWTNSPTSYEYRWMYADFEGGTLTAFSPARSGTFSGTTTNLVTEGATTAQVQNWDDKYIYLQVRATNGSGTSGWVTSLNFAHMVKYAPFIYDAKMFRSGTQLLTTTPVSSGQTITGTFSEITDADQISDTYVYDWLYADGSFAANDLGTTSYSTSAADVGKQIKFRVTGSNTGGEGTAESNLTATITEGYPGYSFTMNNTVYVSTNGYIGLTSGSVGSSIPTTGTVIVIQAEDLVVTDIRRWSDDSKYIITVDSYKYGFVNQSAYRLKYQITFYTLQAYADYRIVSYGSSMLTSNTFGLYYNGARVGPGYPGPFGYGANTTMRIYYNGATPLAYVGTTTPPDAAGIAISTTPTVGSSDDGYYTITTAANVYTLPFNTLNAATATSSTISASSSNSGGDFNLQSYVVRTGSHSGTLVTSGTSSDPNFYVTGLNSGIRYYVTTTPVNSMGQSGTSYQFDIQTTSAPGAFNVTSVTKTKPVSAGGLRTVVVNWGQSANATKYEFAIQGSTDGSTGWTTVSADGGDGVIRTWTLDSSPYYDYGTGTKTFTSVTYYPYYRVTMRARGADLNLANAAYSNGGSSTFLSYVNAAGSAPGKPTLTTPTGSDLTATSVNIGYSFPADTGSNHIDWIQFSTDQVNWSNDFSSPYTLSTTGNTSYTVYARSLNYDGFVSATPHNSVSFTTPQALAAPTNLTATTTDSTKIRVEWSGGYGTTYEIYYANASSATDTTYSKPTDQQAFADYTGLTTSPYDAFPSGTRGVYRRFWVRSKVGTSLSNWYPGVTSGILGYMPLYAPGLVGSLTNSNKSTTSLSFWWNAPTTSSSADAATSYDYALTTSTSTPSSGWTNRTSVPTSASPLTISSLTSNTQYYLHVRAKNADATGSSTYVDAKTDATVSIPGAPSPSWGTLTYAGSNLTTTLSNAAAGNSTKTQSWSYSNTVTFPVSWSAVTGAASYDYFFSSSSTAPTSTTTPTGNTTSLTFSATGTQSNRNTISRYAWVRSKNTAGTSAWVGTGIRTSTATTISGFVIRLYRSGSTTIFTTGAPTGGSTTTALSYAYTGVSTSFAHYATASGTIGGTNLSASSA